MKPIGKRIAGVALGLLLGNSSVHAQPAQYHVNSRHSNHAAYANGPGHSGTLPTLNATFSPPRPAIVSASAVPTYGSQPVIANDANGPRYLFWTAYWSDNPGNSWAELVRADLSMGITAEIATAAATSSLTPAITTDGARVLFAYNPPGVYDPVKHYTFVNGQVYSFSVTTGALVGPNAQMDAPVSECTTAKIGTQHWAYFRTSTTYSYGPPPVEVTGERVWACNIGGGGGWFSSIRFYTYPAAANQTAGLTGDVVVSEPSLQQPTQTLNCLVGRWQNMPHPENNPPTLDILSLNPSTLGGGVAYVTGLNVASDPGLLALGLPYDGAPNTPYTIYLNTGGSLTAYRGGSSVWLRGIGINTQGGPTVQSGVGLSSEIAFEIGNYFSGYSSYGVLYAFFGDGTTKYSPPAGLGRSSFGMGAYDVLVDQGGYQYVPFAGTSGVALLDTSGSILWYSGGHGYRFPVTLPGFSPAIDTAGRLYLTQFDGTVRRYTGP
jgi:hypothetical protein